MRKRQLLLLVMFVLAVPVLADVVAKVCTRVPNPIDTPGQGTYSGAQTVTLSDSSYTGAGLFICYTTDGTDPWFTGSVCGNGTHYTGTFSTGASTVTIKYVACGTNYSCSTVQSSTYTISSTSITETASSQRTGQTACPGGGNKAFAGNVTAGHDIIIGTIVTHSGTGLAEKVPSKASGTATIGAITKDRTYAFDDGGTNHYIISIWSAPVTGTGSLTLAFSAGTNVDCSLQAFDEFQRSTGNIAADGVGVTNTATSATESTGNIVTSASGVVVMASVELSTGDFTYTLSDTPIFSEAHGSSTFTGEVQFKITTANTYDLTAATGNSWFWGAAGMAYK